MPLTCQYHLEPGKKPGIEGPARLEIAHGELNASDSVHLHGGFYPIPTDGRVKAETFDLAAPLYDAFADCGTARRRFAVTCPRGRLAVRRFLGCLRTVSYQDCPVLEGIKARRPYRVSIEDRSCKVGSFKRS